jgi:hypothetical protein
VGATGTVAVRVRLVATATPGTVVTNRANYTGDLTVSPLTAEWPTVVVP